MDLVRETVAACLTVKPGYSIKRFMSKLPFKVPADIEQIAAPLGLAGLPD